MLQIKIIIYERPHFSAGVGSTGVDKKPATKSLYVLDCREPRGRNTMEIISHKTNRYYETKATGQRKPEQFAPATNIQWIS